MNASDFKTCSDEAWIRKLGDIFIWINNIFPSLSDDEYHLAVHILNVMCG